MERRQKHYLTVKPISDVRSEVEARIDELSRITSIGKATLIHLFTGSALQVLKSSTSKKELNHLASELMDAGVFSTVISKDDISTFGKAHSIKSIAITDDYITLSTLEDSKKDFRVTKDTKCIIVVSTPSHERIQNKRMARTALNVETPLSPYEILSTIFKNTPIMDIFVEGIQAPLRIASAGFNHNSLGDDNRQSAALNFPFIIKKIKDVAESVTIDAGYGENNLPFLDIEDRDFYREFSKYSAFIALAFADGIFTIPPTYGGVLEVPVIKELSSIIWGGPLIVKNSTEEKSEKEAKELKTSKSSSLKPPPEAPVKISFRRGSLRPIRRFFTHIGVNIRTLGPSFITYPLSIIMILSLILSPVINSMAMLPFGVTAVGLILFTHAFTLISRKRAIENCPTSRVKTMPMGEVEVTGRVRAKYYLRAPLSMTECAYYSYKIYERIQSNSGSREELIEFGHSGNVPFYLEDLEDKDERTLIIPTDAIVKTGRTETYRGDALSGILTGLSGTQSNRRAVETTIPIGSNLFVMGFAHRVVTTRREKRADLTKKLTALKDNQSLLLSKYDTDTNGLVDGREWSDAVTDLKDEVLIERLNASSIKQTDDIAIGAHPTGGLFYISDKHEESILASMKWRIPLFLILGLTGSSLGGLYVLKVLGNKDILDKLSALIN